MPTFEMPKSFDEIEEAKLAPEGTYKHVITRFEVKPNKANTGNNIELDLCIAGEGPDVDGITHTEWISMPSTIDADRKTKNGQPMVDFKMEKIQEIVEALNGEIVGNKFSIPDGAVCKRKIKVETNPETGKKFNRADGPILRYTATKKGGPKKS